MEETPYLESNETIRQKFKHLPLIGSLSENDQLALLHASRVRRFAAGEMISHQGEYDHWIYILIQGAIVVSNSGQRLAEITAAGEIFGELCLVDSKPRSATLTARERTFCLAVDTRLLGEVAASNRDAFYALIYRMVAELLSARLRASNDKVVALQQQLEALQASAATG